jgi:autotransporter translocation and assembly factor TamB
VRAPKAIPDNLKVRGMRGELVRPIDVKQAKKEEKEAKVAAGEVVDDGDRGHLGIKVKLVDPIVFTGPATEMTWSGALAVATGGAAKPVVTGQLRADEGRFDLLGNRFKIETGEVTLPEGELTIDPFLSVVAATDTPVATVKVTIRGRVSRPQLIFSSEPSMPQQQILTLLLTGSADANEADAQKVLAEAATLLVIAENPALANFVRSATGLDYIGVSFGETTNQPILTVGKHVNKRIYAETSYKHNAPMRQNRVEAKVELEVAPHWAVETYFGDAAVGGVDLFWRKVFGKPQALKAKPAPATPRAAKPVEAPSGATGP